MAGKKKIKTEQKTSPDSYPAEIQDSSIPDVQDFPVVGIGASAGGLNALEIFFKSVKESDEFGITYIVVQHLDPDHKSILSDLVKQYTKMNVYVVEDGMKVKSNSIYIIPPNCDMAFFHGCLQLMKPSRPRGLRLPIDYFFRSLAEDLRERAICIIMSGTGSDGTLGLKAIKGEGGIAIVQSPESCGYDGMPLSAISTGLVDFILPPEKMPLQLKEYVGQIFNNKSVILDNKWLYSENEMKKIFIIIRNQTGHDFSYYKPNTINRRIRRRMVLNKFESIKDYSYYLKNNPVEVDTLFRELLIGVTNFFRDSQAFDSIKNDVIPKLFADKSAGSAVRIWVPACSTGEESYSFSILLQEYMDDKKLNFNVQIFATDIDSESIETARKGIYPESIAADVTPERLSRFFTFENNTYRINKNIRDMVVFAKQDAIKDPPFTKLDLISCRNLLIYFGSELQKKMISIFYYALNPGGFLVLGNSESIGDLTDSFKPLSKKWKIFICNEKEKENTRNVYNDIKVPIINKILSGTNAKTEPFILKPNVREYLEKYLLDNYTPPCIIINHDFDVLFIHGHTGKYLELPAGNPCMNLSGMMRDGIKIELTMAVRKVITQNNPVRYDNLRIINNENTITLNLDVQPIKIFEPARKLILIIFEEVHSIITQDMIIEPNTNKDQWISDLERDLRTKDEYLKSAIEQLETNNEELKSTNEELQSANEELQSANEELETSKEELQSLNEELSTVNSELQKKIEELSYVNNDMNNLLASTGIGTIFIDHKLYIRRFTPAASQIFKLISSDINRPISDIVSRLIDFPSLIENLGKVLDTLIPIEAEVQNTDGKRFSMKIQPYRTLENVIEGAVLTFFEINKGK